MPKYRALMDLFHNNYLFLTVFGKDQYKTGLDG